MSECTEHQKDPPLNLRVFQAVNRALGDIVGSKRILQYLPKRAEQLLDTAQIIQPRLERIRSELDINLRAALEKPDRNGEDRIQTVCAAYERIRTQMARHLSNELALMDFTDIHKIFHDAFSSEVAAIFSDENARKSISQEGS